jgi:hypothetical protein
MQTLDLLWSRSKLFLGLPYASFAEWRATATTSGIGFEASRGGSVPVMRAAMRSK